MVFSNNLLMGAAGQSTGYEIDQSIRFDKTTSSHLSKTYGSAGNRKTWTFSTWFKRGKIDGTRQSFFAATGQAYLQIGPDAASREMITILNEGSGTNLNWYTTQVFRDPSAWYHLVWQFDSTQASGDDRTKLYINGSQVTDFTKAATPSLNLEGAINNAVEHKIGELHIANYYFDGYQAEINFIDGTALDPTNFGEYNADGVWVPIAYTGSYGTNGFYITGATASDLGEDFSGNNNDYTSSGLTTADQMVDTPTTVYPTINPTFDYYTSGNTSYYRPNYAVSKVSDGDLKIVYASPNTPINYCTMSFGSSGKFYFEVTAAVASALVIGIGGSKNIELGIGSSSSTAMANVIGYYANGTLFDQNATAATYGNASSIADGEFVGVAYSVDDDAIWFCDNGTWVDGNGTESSATVLAQIEAGNTTSAASTGFTDDQNAWFPFVAAVGDYPTAVFNFGQSSFTGAAPSGFTHLNTANLVTPLIKDGSKYFQPTLYTGTGSSQAVTQSGNSTFQPDWVWIKGRSGATEHVLTDAVRGVTKELSSNDTGAEETVAQGLTTFGSAGFTVGTDGSYNTSSATYVGWQWAANGSGSSNEDGTINTTATSVNTTAGFSISTYTGTGANATVGHGLGVAPSFVLVKSRNDTHDWYVWTPALATTEFLLLNSTAAKGTSSPEVWNSTAPTSSVVSLGTSIGVNRNTYNYVMYCFAEIPGYSSFGGYTGNGSTDGTFVYTGFSPAFIMYKVTSTTDSWEMYDTTRQTSNVYGTQVKANLSNAETDDTRIDILSNGFKARSTNTAVNASGATYIYMAFAENPFGGDGVAPATAR